MGHKLIRPAYLPHLFLSLLILLAVSCRPAEGDQEDRPAVPLFEIMDAEHTGIRFQNVLSESTFMNGIVDNYYYNGAGLAVADFNGDGLQDIYFLSTLGDNALYLNKGDLRFEETAETAGVKSPHGYQVGAATVDINADGRMDIYLSNSGKFNGADDGLSEDPEIRRNVLFVNMGNDENGVPLFEDQAADYGLDLSFYSTQAAFLDYDRDNDLDMFLINQFPDDYALTDIQGLLERESPYTGDRLYENRNNRFVEVSQEAGLVINGITADLGVAVGDVNNDGWPDVYVSNDFPGKDHLYLNNGDGTFSTEEDRAIKHMPYASMGNDMADFNNDGWIDIFTLDMASEDNLRQKTSIKILKAALAETLPGLGLHHQYMYNCLQLNNGVNASGQVPVFSEIARMAGFPATDWSWGPLAIDMDNDGWKDLFIANGIRRDLINMDYLMFKNRQFAAFMEHRIDADQYVKSVMEVMPVRTKPDYFFRNNGDLTFEKMNGTWVEDLESCNNGTAYADLDNDGDLDIVVNNSGGNSYIYKSLAREKGTGNYIQFELEGPEKNPFGIGTRVVLYQEDREQLVELYMTRGFQSSGTPILHLGCGKDEVIPKVEVIWPDGLKQELKQMQCNMRHTLRYSEADQEHEYHFPVPQYFSETGDLPGISHRHLENGFDDFGREFMLPHRMSTLGPALAAADVDGNGLEDLFIGGAIGEAATLYLQEEQGFFRAAHQAWQTDLNKEDIKAAFFDADGDGDPDLYVVSGGNEYDAGSPEYTDRLYENMGNARFRKAPGALPGLKVSGSCVVPGDYDGDGDADLFVGGRQNPGQYPTPVSSFLLRNDSRNGKLIFTDVSTEAAPVLKDLGMVTDALWSDVDGSGSPDLVIVGEWMSPRILLNQDGQFTDKTENSGLSMETGWWNCVTAADFDGDGDVDLVAGNLGLNYNFKGTKEWPFEVYSGDFDNNGKRDIVMAYYNQGILYPWHGLLRSNQQLPFIKYRFQTYDAFGRASLAEIMGQENLNNALHYKAYNFASSYLENRGDGTFEPGTLDNRAQITALQSIISEDVDGDGNLDLILTGNLYGSEPEVTRADAGVGLFMKGDGSGNFTPVPPVESGLHLDGDIKNALLIRVGKEGNRYIVAASNNGPVKATRILQK